MCGESLAHDVSEEVILAHQTHGLHRLIGLGRHVFDHLRPVDRELREVRNRLEDILQAPLGNLVGQCIGHDVGHHGALCNYRRRNRGTRRVGAHDCRDLLVGNHAVGLGIGFVWGRGVAIDRDNFPANALNPTFGVDLFDRHIDGGLDQLPRLCKPPGEWQQKSNFDVLGLGSCQRRQSSGSGRCADCGDGGTTGRVLCNRIFMVHGARLLFGKNERFRARLSTF